VVAQYQNDINFPYRRYQVQNVWRADKPQKGRLREFTQCDADIIGSDNPTSDAEILAVYAAIYYEIGFGNFKIKINDRETLINNIKDAGVNDDMIFSVIQTIDKLDKKSKEEVLKELKDRGVEEKNANKLLEMLEKAKLPKKLATIINYAKQLGVKADTFQFEPTLARGLDYYTDVIFEGSIPEYSAGSVGAGGRYNNLLNDLVGVDMPAVGFGLGFDRTLEAAKELGKLPKKQTTTQVLVTIFSEEQMEDSLQVTNLLRKNNVQVECYPDTAKINKQLKYANNKEIPYVVIIGPEEKTNKTVQLKNMQSGEQKNVNIDELSEINF
jgi:histidyl-tRNA synthetase